MRKTRSPQRKFFSLREGAQTVMDLRMSRHSDKPISWLSYILGVAFAVRTLIPVLAYFYTRDVTIFRVPDTASYVEPARQLMAHGRFSARDGTPEIIRTPGYPMLLVPGLLVHRLDLITITLQILISCFTVYLVYRTADLLFETEKVALLAAALYAVEPLSILHTGILGTETLFTSSVMVSVFYLMKYLRRQSLWYLLASGVGFAASVYVRPVGYFLPMVLAVALSAWFMITGQHNKRRLMFHISVFVVVSLGLSSLWQVRNNVETGYSGFSGISSINLYFDSAASVLAAAQHVPWREMQNRLGYQDERIYFQRHPEQKAWPLAQRLDFMSRAAIRILLSNPLTYARIHFEGILRSIFDPGSTEFVKFFDLYPKQGGLLGVLVDQGAIKTIEALFLTRPLAFWSNVVLLPLLAIDLLCACAVLFSKRLMRDPCILTALLIAAYYLLISGGPGALGRFRHPAMPIISILAGCGITRIGAIRFRKHRDSYDKIVKLRRSKNLASMASCLERWRVKG
jgi:4-amino-4-deoxy-L-arabinose transferase-like glycosyltransferase